MPGKPISAQDFTHEPSNQSRSSGKGECGMRSDDAASSCLGSFSQFFVSVAVVVDEGTKSFSVIGANLASVPSPDGCGGGKADLASGEEGGSLWDFFSSLFALCFSLEAGSRPTASMVPHPSLR